MSIFSNGSNCWALTIDVNSRKTIEKLLNTNTRSPFPLESIQVKNTKTNSNKKVYINDIESFIDIFKKDLKMNIKKSSSMVKNKQLLIQRKTEEAHSIKNTLAEALNEKQSNNSVITHPLKQNPDYYIGQKLDETG